MSSITPWDLFSQLHKQAQDGQKSEEALLHMLKERASYEEFYAKGLDRMGLTDVLDSGTLGHAFSELKSDCGNKAHQSRVLAENITNDLAEQLQSFLVRQTTLSKKVATEGKVLSEEANQMKNTHDLAYQRYRRTCAELDRVMARLETHSGDADERYGDLSRLMSLKKEYWDAAKQYKNALEQYQVAHYDAMEKARRETLKDTLRKLVVYETAWLRNLQYETEKMATVLPIQIMETISPEEDLQSLAQILNPETTSLPVLQFKPWTNEDVKPTLLPEESSSLLGRLRRVTGRIFQFGKDEKAAGFIAAQVDRACEGQEMKMDEEFALHTLLKDKPGRHFWLSYCQRKVAQGPISLPRTALLKLADQIKMIFNECAKGKESDLPIVLLSFAQKINSITSSRETLFTFLISAPIWKNQWLWEQAEDGHNPGTHLALQNLMESLKLDPKFIENALGRYIRRPSLSVSGLRREVARRGVPKWVEELDCRNPFNVRLSISISQMIPSLNTEEDLDPELTTEQAESAEVSLQEDYDKKEDTQHLEDETYVSLKHTSTKSRFAQVQNLPQNVDEALLRAFFSPCGQVQEVHIVRGPETCGALLEFSSIREAEKAVNLSGMDLHDRVLSIKYGGSVPDF